MLGLSLAGFTVLHVAISVIAITAGFIVVGGMLSASRLPAMTAIFLAATVLTSVTGFMFPITVFTPALGFGILSSVLLLVALAAAYLFNFARIWRGIYVVTALFALYLNSFVAVVQTFQKVTVLTPLAEGVAFATTQLVLLVCFVIIGVLAWRKFHPTDA